MSKDSNVAAAAARLAGLHRWHEPSPEADASARRDLAAAKLEKAIREALDAAPPLTSGQRDRLSVLLSGGNHG